MGIIASCPGYLNAIKYVPEEPEGEGAKLGSCAHELAERSMRYGTPVSSFKGLTLYKDVVVDDEMIEHVERYINHCKAITVQNAHWLAEEYWEMGVSILPIPEVYGTSDFVFKGSDTIFVRDLKYGFEVVEVKDNLQLILYGLGAWYTLGCPSEITKFNLGIVQSRIGHEDGDIRVVEYSIYEMAAYINVVKEAIRLSKNKDATRIAGSHCKNCRASGDCRTRLKDVIFKASFDKPINQLSNEEIQATISEISSLRKNLERIESHALSLALSGTTFKNHKLVRGIARGVCVDEEAFVNEALNLGISKDELYNRKLKGKTPMIKLLGKDIVNKYYVTPEAASTLVKSTDSRTAIRYNPLESWEGIKLDE